jgi:predicted transcriptional regulator
MMERVRSIAMKNPEKKLEKQFKSMNFHAFYRLLTKKHSVTRRNYSF